MQFCQTSCFSVCMTASIKSRKKRAVKKKAELFVKLVSAFRHRREPYNPSLRRSKAFCQPQRDKSASPFLSTGYDLLGIRAESESPIKPASHHVYAVAKHMRHRRALQLLWEPRLGCTLRARISLNRSPKLKQYLPLFIKSRMRRGRSKTGVH